jgi:heme-degrading monooxygenase HmoA
VTVVSVLRLPVRESAREELASSFDELQVFERSRESGGFLGGRLLRPLAGDGPFLVMAEWESADAYQAWLDNPLRASLAARLEPLLSGDVAAGELFEQV